MWTGRKGADVLKTGSYSVGLSENTNGCQKRNIIMSERQETIELLRRKIDECDELLVEISQLRYRLDAIVNLMDHKPDKPVLRRRHKGTTNGIVA